MNVKYEGDHKPFLTRIETEQMIMFHGFMMYIIHDCHFQGNINTRYCLNKHEILISPAMSYLALYILLPWKRQNK